MGIRTSKGIRGMTIRLTGSDARSFHRLLSAAYDPTFAYCFASGVIGLGKSVPGSALEIAHGCQQSVETLIAATCRLSSDNKTFLVPGIPEAENVGAALDALQTYLHWIKPRGDAALIIASGA